MFLALEALGVRPLEPIPPIWQEVQPMTPRSRNTGAARIQREARAKRNRKKGK